MWYIKNWFFLFILWWNNHWKIFSTIFLYMKSNSCKMKMFYQKLFWYNENILQYNKQVLRVFFLWISRVFICQVWECFIDHWVVFGLFLKKKGLYLGLYVNYDSFCCCCCCAINDFLILLWRQICMITCVRSRSDAILRYCIECNYSLFLS